MPASALSAPIHLAIVVTDSKTGRPVTRLPPYAEIAVPRIKAVPPLSDRIREPMPAAFFYVEPDARQEELDHVENAAAQALGQTIEEASREELATQPQRTLDMFRDVYKRAREKSGRERLGAVPHAELVGLVSC